MDVRERLRAGIARSSSASPPQKPVAPPSWPSAFASTSAGATTGRGCASIATCTTTPPCTCSQDSEGSPAMACWPGARGSCSVRSAQGFQFPAQDAFDFSLPLGVGDIPVRQYRGWPAGVRAPGRSCPRRTADIPRAHAGGVSLLAAGRDPLWARHHQAAARPRAPRRGRGPARDPLGPADLSAQRPIAGYFYCHRTPTFRSTGPTTSCRPSSGRWRTTGYSRRTLCSREPVASARVALRQPRSVVSSGSSR
jgi:hypothetical protein